MLPTTYHGGCLCGWIRFEAQGPAEKPHTCSCRSCQQHSGALTSLWVEFSRERVAWTGEGGLPTVYRSSEYSSRAFCSRCGSSIGAVDDEPVVALLVGVFDDPSAPELKPEHHSFEDSQPDWWRV